MSALLGLAAWGLGALAASGRFSPPARVVQSDATPRAGRIMFTWTTDRACAAGVVLWPVADHTAKRHVPSAGVGSRHSVEVDGLIPGTRYLTVIAIEHRTGTYWSRISGLSTPPSLASP